MIAGPNRLKPGLVRLRGRLHGGVEVPVRPKHPRPVTEGYCVVATRGKELPAGTACLAGILMRAKGCMHLAETPLTGKPDAGNPPVRFGGRGEANPSSLPL